MNELERAIIDLAHLFDALGLEYAIMGGIAVRSRIAGAKPGMKVQ